MLSAWRAAQVKLPQTTSTTCCGQSGSIYPPGNSTSASETPITIVSHSTLLRAPRSLDRRVSLFLYSKKTSNPASDFTTSLSQPYVFLSVFIQFRPSGLNNSNTPPPHYSQLPNCSFPANSLDLEESTHLTPSVKLLSTSGENYTMIWMVGTTNLPWQGSAVF